MQDAKLRARFQYQVDDVSAPGGQGARAVSAQSRACVSMCLRARLCATSTRWLLQFKKQATSVHHLDSFYTHLDSFCTHLKNVGTHLDSFCTHLDSFCTHFDSFCTHFNSSYNRLDSFCTHLDIVFIYL